MTNGTQKLQATAEQLATILLIEGLLQDMQRAANQLGGFMRYEPGAQAIGHAMTVLGADYDRLREMWTKSVVIAPASALSVIEGKAH